MSHDVGDELTLTAYFTAGGVAADPTAVTCTVIGPTDSETGGTTVTTTNPAVGTYTGTFTPTVDGRHVVKWVGTGAVDQTHWQSFIVRDAYQEESGGPFPFGRQSWESAVS